jgi:hypothetical protein
LIKTGEKKLLQTLAWEDEKQRILIRAHKHMEGQWEKSEPDRIHFGGEGLEREQKAEHELLVLVRTECGQGSEPYMVMQTYSIPIEDVKTTHPRRACDCRHLSSVYLSFSSCVPVSEK